MTAHRYTIRRRYSGHVWHVHDRYRAVTDVVAFRPTGAALTADPFAIMVITDEARSPDNISHVERRLARRVGLRIP